MSTISFNEYSLVSFIYNSYFLNQHFITDYVSKLSFVDTLLVITNASYYNNNVLLLYNYFIIDLYLSFNIQYLPYLSYFTSSYQDIFTLIIFFAPEVIISFSDYFYYYYSGFYNSSPVVSACFDSYTNNLNYNFNEGFISFFLFFFFS